MTLLILGLLLWAGAHLVKRLAPGARAVLQDKMGDGSKGLIAALILLSVVLMVLGYRSADGAVYWGRTGAMVGINNLLMVVAVALFGVGNSKSRLRGKMRHPMLTGLIVWGVAHLLVNGDVPSFVLFGGLIAWALLEMILVNRAEHEYVPYDGGSFAGDVRLAVITLVVYAVISGIHWWLGYVPFGA
ncbi:hypothetical protein EF888_18560 [Silicimonas algicola]|uniref:NnrU protein n=1 Tax=Silicimonas algicola TaxID=1826607 RepID=A0A316G6X8_9RHOB|nr:NnrU family protein [Silicimonas algicola]AZQ68953.1 hypothetical protein EF888_18560 [Silicimonas algicola]PWK55945.1 NnrU protein [Silicimonas algicola]